MESRGCCRGGAGGWGGGGGDNSVGLMAESWMKSSEPDPISSVTACAWQKCYSTYNKLHTDTDYVLGSMVTVIYH
jgi:hypothetical protein